MIFLDDYAVRNWVISPAPLALNEPPPASIYDQKWQMILSGVVLANLQGAASGQWRRETVAFRGDTFPSEPASWAVQRYAIPQPPPGYADLSFEVEQWAPFVSVSAIFNKNQSFNSGFAVDAWRMAPSQVHGRDEITGRQIKATYAGLHVDVAVRDTDAWLYRLGYNITLTGRIVFVAR